jgi:hypothetical protein
VAALTSASPAADPSPTTEAQPTPTLEPPGDLGSPSATPSPSITDILPTPSGGGGGSSDPFAPLTDAIDQLQNSGGGSQPDVASALQTLATCLQGAQSAAQPFAAGQRCVENFIATLTNDPRSSCFSQNNFTLQFLVDRLQSGQPPSQADAQQFQQNLAGLIACLSGSSSAPSGGGGAAVASSSPDTGGEAPAATPVTGTPNFTG